MTTDLLEKRLHELEVSTPDAGRVSSRALAKPSRQSRRAVPRFALGAVACVALAALIAYFAPAADTAVAGVPIAGDALRDAGLIGAQDRITSVGSTSSSSGYKVTLVAAYADSTRTVLFLKSDPAAITFGPTNGLTDQFGRSYNPANGSGNLLTGESVLQFQPFAWPISITGARITLQLSEVETGLNATTAVKGSWTLHATLGLEEGTALALPQPATLGRAHFAFTSISYTPASIAVDINITGVTFDDLNRRLPDGLKGTPAFQIDLLDPSGANITGASEMNDDWLGVIHLHALGYRTGGTGAYTVRVGYLGESFERTLLIT